MGGSHTEDNVHWIGEMGLKTLEQASLTEPGCPTYWVGETANKLFS